MPMGNFPESLSQVILAGRFLVGGLGVAAPGLEQPEGARDLQAHLLLREDPGPQIIYVYCIYIYIYTYCMCIYIYIYIHTYIHVYIYIYIYIHTHVISIIVYMGLPTTKESRSEHLSGGTSLSNQT